MYYIKMPSQRKKSVKKPSLKKIKAPIKKSKKTSKKGTKTKRKLNPFMIALGKARKSGANSFEYTRDANTKPTVYVKKTKKMKKSGATFVYYEKK